jgi:hypothetical protein
MLMVAPWMALVEGDYSIRVPDFTCSTRREDEARCSQYPKCMVHVFLDASS